MSAPSGASAAAAAAGGECVRVVVRCRPMSSKEAAAGHKRVVDVDERDRTISVNGGAGAQSNEAKTFGFDAVFDVTCTQKQVYDQTARSIVDSVLEGYNGTIFAYGQTGAGKTHTMEGSLDSPDDYGIIPNAFHHIFDHINVTQGRRYLVRASFVEIYNEELHDLLGADHSARLQLRENSDGSVYVDGVAWFVVNNSDAVERLLLQGKKNRKVSATNMNERSSRSHSIFTVNIESSEQQGSGKDGEEEHVRVGKLNLVDLAGSERQSKTGAQGQQLKEGANINLSLSALGNVIGALTDSKKGHVPYRNSKLTRLLQDSLGGNAKTVMVANVGPANYNADETISTLRYASRAKNIKNKPKVNEDPKDALLREFQSEIQRLRALLEQKQVAQQQHEAELVSIAPASAAAATAATATAAAAAAAAGAGAGAIATGGVAPTGNAGAAPPVLTVDPSMLAATAEAQAAAQEAAARAAAAAADAEALRQAVEVERATRSAEMARLKEASEAERVALLEQQQAKEREAIAYQQQLEREREEINALRSQLMRMESQVVEGGGKDDEEARLELEKKREEAEREEKIQLELRLKEQEEELRGKQEEAMQLNEKYSSLQEEVSAQRKKMKQLWDRWKQSELDVKDLTAELAASREDLTNQVAELTRQLKLRDLIIDSFVPAEYRAKIEARAEFDEEADEWHVAQIDLAGRYAQVMGGQADGGSAGAAAAAAGGDRGRGPPRSVIHMTLELPDHSAKDVVLGSDMGGVFLSYGADFMATMKRKARGAASVPAAAAAPAALPRTPSPSALAAAQAADQQRRGTSQQPGGVYPSARGLVSQRGGRASSRRDASDDDNDDDGTGGDGYGGRAISSAGGASRSTGAATLYPQSRGLVSAASGARRGAGAGAGSGTDDGDDDDDSAGVYARTNGSSADGYGRDARSPMRPPRGEAPRAVPPRPPAAPSSYGTAAPQVQPADAFPSARGSLQSRSGRRGAGDAGAASEPMAMAVPPRAPAPPQDPSLFPQSRGLVSRAGAKGSRRGASDADDDDDDNDNDDGARSAGGRSTSSSMGSVPSSSGGAMYPQSRGLVSQGRRR